MWAHQSLWYAYSEGNKNVNSERERERERERIAGFGNPSATNEFLLPTSSFKSRQPIVDLDAVK